MPKSHTVHFVRNGEPVKENLPIMENAGISLTFYPEVEPGKFTTPMQKASIVYSTDEMDQLVRINLLSKTDKVNGTIRAFFDVDGQRYSGIASVSRTKAGAVVWSGFTLSG